jgi:hypothetical protein
MTDNEAELMKAAPWLFTLLLLLLLNCLSHLHQTSANFHCDGACVLTNFSQMNCSNHIFCENESNIITGSTNHDLSQRFIDCTIESAYVRPCKDNSDYGNKIGKKKCNSYCDIQNSQRVLCSSLSLLLFVHKTILKIYNMIGHAVA